MRTGNNLFSAVQFMVVVAVLCAGGFFVALPYAPLVRFKMAAFFSEREDLFLPIGLMILGLGIVLLIGFYAITRRRYFQFKMKCGSVTIQPALLNELAGAVWKKYFPEEGLFTDIVVHANQKIELVAEATKISEPVLLEAVEKELTELFKKQIGYEEEIIVTVVLK